MFRIELNSECKNQVLVNFVGLSEEYSDFDFYSNWIDECYHILDMFKDAYPKLVECVDKLENYSYSIECDDEEQAEDVEEWFSMLFDDLETEINDELDALMEEYEE